MFPERDTSLFYSLPGMFIYLTVHLEKKYSTLAYSYMFWVSFHSFLTGSDTQKFRVSAYSRDPLMGE